MSTDYGTDIDCIDDAGAHWRTTSGHALVLQDVYHRLTTRSVVGRILNADGTIEPNPAAEEYGEDVRELIGSKNDDLAFIGPRLSAVIQRSKRIETCDVTAEEEDAGNGNVFLRLRVRGTSNAGPFDFVFLASSTTLKLLSGGAK